ncbi:MAG: phospho-sugar mutase [Chthoniobacterales bacterium]|nr:phospho-sugar mutase [Chthoniobacterales bacterium]
MTTLLQSITSAVAAGNLSSSSAENIRMLLKQEAPSSFSERVVQELVAREEWKELNDRFFRTLAFGTGGLRGKTMGEVITSLELGNKRSDGRPEFSCVGTNMINDATITRATRGLVTYVCRWHRKQQRLGRPKICISYDTRFFSREFAELTANVVREYGCDALLFEAPRSTPELSFAVRYCKATAGVNITASHNPPAYNGYKVYFEDGAQVIEPHATAIIELVDQVEKEKHEPLTNEQQGEMLLLGTALDEAYRERLESLVLQPDLFQTHEIKVVYTPLHGVGGVIIVPLLNSVGVTCLPVAAQMVPDGLFSTVRSPNPENAEALTLGITLAEKENADLVIATDPDDDRMGVAVRDAAGQFQLLTGNQIGVLLVWYRLEQLFALGVLNEENKKHAVVIKSIVTTDLQKAITEKRGVSCVETLTGFKYIGAKLERYEKLLPAAIQTSYRELSEAESRAARLRDALYFVFGGEESYGYSLGDFVRDKDGNAAALCFSEVAAYAKSQHKTLPELLDQIYSEYGFYCERGESLAFEGAQGAGQMKNLIDSYTTTAPLQSIDGKKVVQFQNFETETILDSEGEVLPKEAMLIFTLEGDARVIVRPSGTEPKIKYYLFAAKKPVAGTFSKEELRCVKQQLQQELERLWEWLKKDALDRV